MGGCTRSSVLMQILADVVGCPVQVTHSAHVGMNCLWGGVHSKKCQVPRCTNRESSEPKTIHTTPSVKQKQKQTWPRKDNVRDPFHFQLGSTHPQIHFLQHPASNTLEAYLRPPSPFAFSISRSPCCCFLAREGVSHRLSHSCVGVFPGALGASVIAGVGLRWFADLEVLQLPEVWPPQPPSPRVK